MRVIIELEFEGDGESPETVKETVYQYLEDLIQDDSLSYTVTE